MDGSNLRQRRPKSCDTFFGHLFPRLLAVVALSAPLGCAQQEQPAPPLDVRTAVFDATYPLDHLGAGTVRLKEGAYRDSVVGISTRIIETATGDMNRDDRLDAAVVLSTDRGGSGTFVDLFAVLDEAGRAVTRGPASLGDRVKVDSIAVRNGAIEVHMVTHGPEDALCCPTRAVVQHYVMQGDTLVQRPQELP